MTHGGGTVAGESPDRSEQRKSSGETTQEERDPRLSVFRQAAQEPGSDDDTSSSSTDDTPEDPSATPDDARLRAAVAAWVATADDEPDGEAGSAASPSRAPAPDPADAEGADGGSAAGAADADPGADSGGSAEGAASGASKAADRSADAGTQVSDRPSEQDSATGSEAGGSAADEPAGAAADRDGAAGAAGAHGNEPDDSGVRGRPADADADMDADADADMDADPDADMDADPDMDGAADGGDSSGGSGADARDSAERSADAVPPADATSAVKPADAADPASEGVPAGRSDDAGERAPGGDSGATDAAPVREGTMTLSVVREPAGAADSADSADGPGADRSGQAGADAPEGAERPAASTAKGGAGASAGADGATEGTAPSDGGEQRTSTGDDAPTPVPVSSSGASAKSEGGVDQPTTVFKALRRPPVDQPTTALKLPSLPKPSAKPSARPAAQPEPEPESDAERTSTFVPLRRDDVRPAPAKPVKPAAPAEPAAPATPAAPVGTGLPAEQPPASLGEAERTRQQPMPPLPPLDLLAELTNTPPPPETPVRTAVRRIKIWTPLVLLLLIVFAVVQLVRPLPDPTLALTAEQTYTFEGGKLELPWPAEGQGAAEVVGVGSLGTYGAQKPAPIASVAKTMTAYVVLRDHPLKGNQVGPSITVDKKAEEESKAKSESTAPIREGQKFTEKQMLQLLMIPSGNNAARLLARWDAGSEEAFVKKMNDAAKDLGMTNSTYTDPSGLKSSTVSTPLDQIKLGKAVMENDVFREIVNMTLVKIPGIEGQIRNNNDRALLMEGVGGIKTGSSTPAGGNLLWSANAVVDGEIRRIVGIVMGAQDAPQLWQKLEKAIDYSIALIPPAQEAVTSATVVKKGDVVGHVDDGLGGRTPVVATKDLKAVGFAGLDVKIEIAENGDAIPHSAKAGTVVGQVSVGEGAGKVSAPVALEKDLAEPGLGAKLTRLG
ncbi:D-alanyl-D-alanine carboxypeptidase [Streptomyces peucetius subsp. caesius ATCC 27952]|nr:D-alanyl-D-alanine carboxypeptidase [Streptomyces peucetius subsp. caesius ATCC 27952]